MDNVSKRTRSKIMASVRSKDTGPERTVRRLAFRNGYRYRIHRADLPGTPDLVFNRPKKAVFVHGCFWHCHDCSRARVPKSRQDYWVPKLEGNRLRDAENAEKLQRLGWKVLVVWECQTLDLDALEQRLCDFLDGRTPYSARRTGVEPGTLETG